LNFDETLFGDKRNLQLHELEDMRLNLYESSKQYKQKMKAYHDKEACEEEFPAKPTSSVIQLKAQIVSWQDQVYNSRNF